MASVSLSITNNINLTSLDLSSLYATADGIDIYSNSSLTSVDLSSFGSAVNINIYGNGLLQTISFLPVGLSPSIASTYIDLGSNALTQANVDEILEIFDMAGNSSGSLNLSGGSNAAPSAGGAASASSLSGKGWTVTTN